MKKIILSLTLLAGMSMTAGAQYQLTNPGFDGEWSTIQPYTGGGSTNVGTTPNGWCLANVAGYKLFAFWTGSTEVGSRVDGRTDYACKLENKETVGNIIPGYITLGTSWNTANTSGGNADGGSFGGVSFTGRPDAIEFWYQRTASDNSQPASVVAYLWKGNTEQKSVPVSIGSSPTTKDMTNRDRNILGMTYSKGGDVTKSEDFALIASLMSDVKRTEDNKEVIKREHIIQLPDVKTSWTKATYEFTYHSVDEKPTMINVVFGAMDYFTDRSNHKKGNTLTVDDVKFIYYSDLKSAIYDGTEIGFEGTTANVASVYDESKLEVSSNGIGATVSKSYDSESAVLTITIEGDDISINPENKHIYTIQFEKEAVQPWQLKDVRYDNSVVSFDGDNKATISAVYDPKLLNVNAIGEGVTIQKFYDGETGKLTIQILGEDYMNENMEIVNPTHISDPYVIQFEAPISSESYTDYLIVDINGWQTQPQEAQMAMYTMSDGSKTLVLKNFVLAEMELPVGNISVPHVQLDDSRAYSTEQDVFISKGDDTSIETWVGPYLGVVPVNMTGYAFDNKFLAHIDINMAALGQTIEVKFGYNYTRTVAADRWGTLCQPFSFTAEQVAATGFKFYSIEGVKWVYGEPQYISLKEEESIQGGMPYIFFSGENTALSLMGGTGYAESPSDKNGLFGVYTRKDLDGGTYILSNNKICGGYANYVEANRAYIDIYDVPELDSNAKGVRFYFNDTTTGIGSLNTEQTSAKAYDLAGRRMAATAKGIYIVNGKKIVLK